MKGCGSNPRSRIAFVRRDHSLPVAPFVWAESNLTLEHRLDAADNKRSMSSILIGLFDSRNIHVLEYAIKESSSGVYVQYARAHEYLQGDPEPIPTDPMDDNTGFIWLDMPSEDVFYLRGPFNESNVVLQAHEPALIEWTSPVIEILEDARDKFEEMQHDHSPGPRVRPASRWIEKQRPWNGDVVCLRPRTFLAAAAHMREAEIRFILQGKKTTISSTTRPTAHTFRRTK